MTKRVANMFNINRFLRNLRLSNETEVRSAVGFGCVKAWVAVKECHRRIDCSFSLALWGQELLNALKDSFRALAQNKGEGSMLLFAADHIPDFLMSTQNVWIDYHSSRWGVIVLKDNCDFDLLSLSFEWMEEGRIHHTTQSARSQIKIRGIWSGNYLCHWRRNKLQVTNIPQFLIDVFCSLRSLNEAESVWFFHGWWSYKCNDPGKSQRSHHPGFSTLDTASSKISGSIVVSSQKPHPYPIKNTHFRKGRLAARCKILNRCFLPTSQCEWDWIWLNCQLSKHKSQMSYTKKTWPFKSIRTTIQPNKKTYILHDTLVSSCHHISVPPSSFVSSLQFCDDQVRHVEDPICTNLLFWACLANEDLRLCWCNGRW